MNYRLLFSFLAAALPAAAADTPAGTQPPKRLEGISQAAVQSAFQILRSEYIRSGDLTFEELNRAALQGLLQRLHLGAELLQRSATEPPALPKGVLAEMLTPEIAYLRPLSYGDDEVAAIETKLRDYRQHKVPHLILDLRTPAPPGDFAVADRLLDLFIPRGQILFRLKQVASEDAELFISNQEPVWTSKLLVLVDEESNNLAETAAAVLRQSGQGLILGAQTRGATVRYETLPLDDHWLLRFARAEMLLPDGTSLFGKGLQPDFPVSLPAAAKRRIFDIPDGVKAVREMVFDQARPRYNEAALIARKNPELESYIRQSQNQGQRGADEDQGPPKDTVLQRAVDMIQARGHFGAATVDWPTTTANDGSATIRKAAPAPSPDDP
jgi:hypothetical protein